MTDRPPPDRRATEGTGRAEDAVPPRSDRRTTQGAGRAEDAVPPPLRINPPLPAPPSPWPAGEPGLPYRSAARHAGPLAPLLRALDAVEVHPTGRELAEALWLAGQIGAPPVAPPAPPPADDDAPAAPPPPPAPRPAPRPAPAPAPPPEPAPIRLPEPSGVDEPGWRQVRVPGAPALPHQLPIGRALRVLRRRVPSRHRVLLDEAATADRAADSRLLLPVTRPAPDRWLSAALVVDTGSSMVIWRPLVAELRTLLRRIGAFADLRTWYLRPANGRVLLSATDGTDGADGAPARSPAELVDPTGRRLILLLTDAVGGHWRDGAMRDVLDRWSAAGPAVVLQPLPERLWRRTGLRTVAGTLSAPEPGVPNTRLTFRPRRGLPPPSPVPVVELDPTWLARWAGLVARPSASGVDAAVGRPAVPVPTPPPPAPPDNAFDRVLRFRTTASPEAFALAGYLSAAPLSLPVMRLVQGTMLPRSGPAHLAEVVLSGLLRRTGEDSDPRYEFIDGVRAVLLGTLRRDEASLVLDRVSGYLADHAGLSTEEFAALVADPATAPPSTPDLLPFARVNTEVLTRLGLARPAPAVGSVGWHRAVVARHEHSLGHRHPTTLGDRAALAGALLSAGASEEAIALYRTVLADRRQALGTDHPDTLDSLADLAGALDQTGEHAEAVEQYERFLSAVSPREDEDSPTTWAVKASLAPLLADARRYAEAAILYRQLVDSRTRDLGADHPDTLAAVAALAGLLPKVDRNAEAESLDRRLVDARTRTVGPDHPDTLDAIAGLADLLMTMDRDAEAITLYDQLTDARTRILGPDHPDTLDSLLHLATLARKAREDTTALALHERLVADLPRVLGLEDTRTWQAVDGLADVLWRLGRHDEAVAVHRRFSDDAERMLGAGHQVTRDARLALAQSLQRAGRYPEAADALAHTLRPGPAGSTEPPDRLLVGTLLRLTGPDGRLTVDPTTRWEDLPPEDRMAVPIGVDDSGTPVELNLRESALGGIGPHGAVLGPDGSGKGMLLRTVILALAATHRPDQFTFLYAGATAGEEPYPATLPHCAGFAVAPSPSSYPDLADALNRERQRRHDLLVDRYRDLAEYEADRRAGAGLPPLPNLLVVLRNADHLLDRSAELADAVAALCRVGRALGIHVLLSAESLDPVPSPVRAALSFRLELGPERGSGAIAVAGQKGRRPLRVAGDRLAEDHRSTNLNPGGAGRRRVHRIWPPGGAPPATEPPETRTATPDPLLAPSIPLSSALGPLETTLERGLGVADRGLWDGLRVPIGFYEPRDRAATAPARVGDLERAWVDFTRSADLAVIGPAGSGKSSLLGSIALALALTHTPERVQFCVIDMSDESWLGWLRNLPHTTAYAGPGDDPMDVVEAAEALVRQRQDRRRGGEGDRFGAVVLLVNDARRLAEQSTLAHASVLNLFGTGTDVHVVASADSREAVLWSPSQQGGPAVLDALGGSRTGAERPGLWEPGWYRDAGNALFVAAMPAVDADLPATQRIGVAEPRGEGGYPSLRAARVAQAFWPIGRGALPVTLLTGPRLADLPFDHLQRLVRAVFEAQGYLTTVPPEDEPDRATGWTRDLPDLVAEYPDGPRLVQVLDATRGDPNHLHRELERLPVRRGESWLLVTPHPGRAEDRGATLDRSGHTRVEVLDGPALARLAKTFLGLTLRV